MMDKINDKELVYVGNKYNKRVVSLPIKNYGKLTKTPFPQLSNSKLQKLKKTIFQPYAKRFTISNNESQILINKSSISSKIALGLTKISNTKIPSVYSNDLFLDVQKVSRTMKQEKKLNKAPVVRLPTKKFTKWKPLDDSFEKTFLPEKFDQTPSPIKENIQFFEKNIQFDKEIVQFNEEIVQFNEENVQFNEENIKVSDEDSTKNDTIKQVSSLGLISIDFIENKPEYQIKKPKEIASYKKKFKIRPKYLTILDFK